MTLLDNYARASRRCPCPICGKPDWCLVSRDDLEDPSSVICSRIESDRRWGAAGWFHRLRKTPFEPGFRARIVEGPPAPLDPAKLRELTSRFQDALGQREISAIVDELGVSEENLLRLGLGWTGSSWSFEMKDDEDRLIGIRLRRVAGGKLCVRGSRQGLFVPSGLSYHGLVLLPEGPSDTAALLDLDFEAVGRPSCNGGAKLVLRLVQRHHIADAVVVADNDYVGRRGAQALAKRLRAICRRVRVLEPPPEHKDVRAWVNAGATRDVVEVAINAAAPITLSVVAERAGSRS